MRETTAPQPASHAWPGWFTPKRLIVAALLFHVMVTVTLYGLGRYHVLPGSVDSNGIAVSFASDGIRLRAEGAHLAAILRSGQLRDWLIAPSPFHIKLYSICFALLGPWLGANILSAEPLNAFCYLSLLVLVFKLGQRIFNSRIGLIAAASVALWPTLLLHTTQLLKDPLFLVGMLAFILVNVRLISENFSWPGALQAGGVGGLIVIFLWLARDSMGALPIVTAALGMVMLIIRQFVEKHFQARNLAGMALMIVVSVGVVRVIPEFHQPKDPWVGLETVTQANASLAAEQARAREKSQTLRSPWSRFVMHVGNARRKFGEQYPDAGSNLDSHVQLTTTSELIRYLPRAAAIGFFAPFPNFWFATGDQVGSAGRLLSGIETVALYVIEGLALVELWNEGWKQRHGRPRFSAFFLGLFAAMGMISLGLVVINVGALYRLRYVFVIPLIILAGAGALQTLEWWQKKRLPANTPATATRN
jgi:hypothetical protein